MTSTTVRTPAPDAPRVLVAGDRRLARAGIAALLAHRFVVEDEQPTEPAGLARSVTGVGSASRFALVLVDPADPAWDDAVRDARRLQPRLGVVTVLGRPAYWHQRRWRQRDPETGTMLTDALLGAGRPPEHLENAVRDVVERPGVESIWWLGRTSKHRGASEAWRPDGDTVREVRATPHLHEGLARLARGESLKSAATALHLHPNTLRAKLRSVKHALGLESDEALGAWAVRTGLVDDVPTGPALASSAEDLE
jgi:hypothetical protein